MARRGNLLDSFAPILQEIATPVCALVRNDTVWGAQVRRFRQLDKLQFELQLRIEGPKGWSVTARVGDELAAGSPSKLQFSNCINQQ